MKKLISALAIVALMLSLAPDVRSQEVSVGFFYDNLNGGNWFEVGDYGYCWQPDVAVNDPTWRPYADGYWAYTDDGWTWVSYEDFGWATYHYGRWVRLAEVGWVWKPGYEWGPAWVSWRTGGNYVGWAPLPPETEYVYESRPLTGHLDIEFDIGPGYYNFCDVRYIGEPVLRSRLVPYQQNVTYITQTVNVTNITYRNKTVYNYGPDINVMNQYSSRPIQRLKLERQANVDVASAAKSGGLTKVQGNALVVAAPPRLNKPAQMMAPPAFKAKVEKAKVEKGWSVVGDPNAQTQLREKIKTQDLKSVPPPTLGAASPKPSVGPKPGAAPDQANASAIPGSSFEKQKVKGEKKNNALENMQHAGLGASLSPGTRPAFPEGGKKKNKRGELNQPSAMTAPSTGGGAEMSPNGMAEGGKKKNKRGELNQPGAMTAPSTGGGAEMSPSGIPETGKPGKGKNRRGEQFGGTPAPTGSMSAPEGTTAPEPKKIQREKNLGGPGGGAMQQGISDEPSGGMKRKFEPQQAGPPPNSQSGAPGASTSMPTQGGAPIGEERGKRRADQVPTGAATGEAPAGNQQPGGGKHEGKKKGAELPSPTP